MCTPGKVMSVSRSQQSITQYNDLETLQLLLKVITHVYFFNTRIQVLMNLDRTSNCDRHNYILIYPNSAISKLKLTT